MNEKLRSEAIALAYSIIVSLEVEDWTRAFEKSKQLERVNFRLYLMTDNRRMVIENGKAKFGD